MKVKTIRSTQELLKEYKSQHPIVQSSVTGKWGFIAHQYYYRTRQHAVTQRARFAYNYALSAPRIIV